MSVERKNIKRIERKQKRVRLKLKRIASDRLRISVFRSANHIYAQAIDDVKQHTIAACSSLELKTTGSKKEVAFAVGKALAQKVVGVNEKYKDHVVFDRGQYRYHGRVAEIAAGLREGGLEF
jgi:large subunit ribosomal protein L18